MGPNLHGTKIVTPDLYLCKKEPSCVIYLIKIEFLVNSTITLLLA